jgi:hypothetical protein
MDSDALLRPVGPRPARVYWMRRLVLLVAVVVVVVLVAQACSGGGTSKPSGASQPPATPTAGASAPSSAVTDCRKADLRVTASTDESTYPAGALPRLSAVVRNVSDTPCRFVTSPDSRVWTIVSGADRVWTSVHCTVSGAQDKKRLRPGRTIAYGLVWNRHRSAKGCPTDTPELEPGTYVLEVSLSGVSAARVVFHLTD